MRMDKTVAESRKRDEEKAEVLTCNYCSRQTAALLLRRDLAPLAQDLPQHGMSHSLQ